MSSRSATGSDLLKPLLLIVEDEVAQAEVLLYNMQKQGYRVVHAQDGEEALLIVEEQEPDLVLLDWMLPGLSGIDVCRRLKASTNTRAIPIIMLTARGEEGDLVRGLETGADDYLAKPYSLVELFARVQAMLRRAGLATSTNRLEYEGLVLDVERHRVTRNGQPLHLGPTEFRLLATFMERPGRIWSRDQLLDQAWGRDVDADLRTVDVHVGRLRKALRMDGTEELIRTVRGEGYALDSEK